MSLKAEVYQRRHSRRWTFHVYDTENPGEVLAHGRYPADQWVTALLDAQSALQRLHLKAFQDRVHTALLRSLSEPIAPLYFWAGMPKTWEGDYA